MSDSMSSFGGLSAGAQVSPIDEDLRAAYEGGKNFMTRVEALSRMRQNADASLAELNLGKSAASALADAQAKQQSAAAAEQAAAETLRQAKETAAGLLADAKVQSDALRANAQALTDKAAKDAAAIVDEARAAAAKLQNDAKTALKAAQVQQDTLKQATDNAEKSRLAHEDAKAKLERAKKRTDDKHDEFEAALARIREALGTAPLPKT